MRLVIPWIVLLCISIRVASEQCSVFDIETDTTCPFTFDGVCDQDLQLCSGPQDCFDCDDCSAYDGTSCGECLDNNGCAWCTLASGLGLCTSLAWAEVLPEMCSSGGGTEFSTASCPSNVTSSLSTCDIANDSCEFAFDLECDGNGIVCGMNSDCFDCDFCLKYSNDCEACIANGCEYCGAGNRGVCNSPNIAADTRFCVAIGGTSYASTCSSVVTPTTCDPLDNPSDTDFDLSCDPNDCFDCQPCQKFIQSCEACTAANCLYCVDGNGRSVCSSPDIAALLPDICVDTDGGTPYVSTCGSLPEEGCDFMNDSCPTRLDLQCDAGITCDSNTDCYDCDPCMSHRDNCSDCIAAQGCQYCQTGDGRGVCSSSAVVKLFPTACSGTGGTPYASTCSVGSPPTTSPPPPPVAYSCDETRDDCLYKNDGACDANGVICRSNSDCFDCDPCQKYRFSGCQTCTDNGCLWCGTSALCISPNLSLPETVSCGSLESTCTESSNPFPDPLFEAQSWVFDLINVQPVWSSGITGDGVGIRINDDGVDASHKDFQDKFDVASSCLLYTPVQLDIKNGHGTGVASIAAAAANDSCSVGVAPGARVSACRIITESAASLTPESADSSFLYDNMENMHISSNSYGVPSCRDTTTGRRQLQGGCPFSKDDALSPCLSPSCLSVDWANPSLNSLCEEDIILYCRSGARFESDVEACSSFFDLYVDCANNGLMPEELEAFTRGITSGRDGKGIIYIFSAGNEFGTGADTNDRGTRNSRYTISVGAVGRNGLHASYSTTGATVFVAAPGGDLESYSNHITAVPGGGCGDITSGTSFSTPVVSGVVALMLEANPELSWRDVQGVLATTSQKTDPDDLTWAVNAAGLHHSYLYGFGLVNANAAVQASRDWNLFPEEIQLTAESGVINASIPDNPESPLVLTLRIASDGGFFVESVAAFLDISHSSLGDLEVVLTSPDGMESVLSPGPRPQRDAVIELWKLATVRSWGEGGLGDWELRVSDNRPGDLYDCVDLQGWETTIDEIVLDCDIFRVANLCVDGVAGPAFFEIFGSLASLDDEEFADKNGVMPDQACCACGGGVEPSSIPDVLTSWRLVVYGHETDTVPGVPGATEGRSPQDTPVPPPASVSTSSAARLGNLHVVFCAVIIFCCYCLDSI